MNQNLNSIHKTVLLQPAVDLLDIKPGHWYIDATLGGGGHTHEILKRCGKVLAIDQDSQAIERTRRFLNQACPNAEFILEHTSFENIESIAQKHNIGYFSGILFDLGISSDQLDTQQRGFSFMKEGPLDMRMDQTKGKTAAELINTLPESQLSSLINQLSDEPRARSIARKIVVAREQQSIDTTTQLAQLIAGNTHAGKIHPATKTFQALRIAVNRELDQIISALPQAWQLLSLGGRLVIISFHSGEDRIVKHFFKYHQDNHSGKILTNKPLQPNEAETKSNSRARSAKLRAIEKTI